MKISAAKLQEILESHGRWLRDNEDGERANLGGADLRYTNLCDADLRDADLRDADLRYADLRDANLRYADLRDADICDADLRDANLRGADLRGADLRYATLRGADLRDANLGKKYYQVTRIGSRKGTTTYCVDDDTVICGCWSHNNGATLDEFKDRIESVYGREGDNPNQQYYDEYMAAISFFAAMKGTK